MEHLRTFLLAVLVTGLIILASGCAKPDAPPDGAEGGDARGKEGGHLLLATTASVYDSGLLGSLIPVFTAKTGIEVRVLSRGTGQALELGRRGDVDVVLVHDRDSELRLVAEGYFTDRFELMYNDFILAGPAADPAGISSAADSKDAFSKIASGNHPFISRGDDSGTHRLELRLWQQAGINPGGGWYFAVGQGMGEALRVAHEKRAYTIADRGTFLSLKDKLQLKILLEGDPLLLNQYGIMAVSPAKHPHVQYAKAKAFINFLVSAEGQELIANFKKGGETLFYPGKGAGD